MPDLNKAIKGRRKNLNKIWSGKEWKEKKAAFLLKNPECQMHKSVGKTVPATIPHHPYRDSYKGHYTDLELSGCVAYCNRCHFALHKGLRLCPICGEHYMRWDQERCRPCFEKAHPEVVEAQKKYKEDLKQRSKTQRKMACQSFPCRFRLQDQKCRKGKICDKNNKNCTECRQYESRSAKPKQSVRL
jgi:hypothetical protein